MDEIGTRRTRASAIPVAGRCSDGDPPQFWNVILLRKSRDGAVRQGYRRPMPAMVPDFHTETGWQMKKQIVRVSAVQSAKVAAMIYLVTSIPLVLLMLVPSMVAGQIFPGFSVGALILIPVLYTVLGFIFTLVAAGIYNLVAARVGGFEFTTAEVGPG